MMIQVAEHTPYKCDLQKEMESLINDFLTLTLSRRNLQFHSTEKDNLSF
jgi:hypothetical protein